MKNVALPWIALALLTNGCNTVTCGAGTQRVGDSCVAIAVDADRPDGAIVVDAGSDAGPPDAPTGQVCPVVAAPASDPGVVSCLQTSCTGSDTCSIDATTGTGSCLPPGSTRLTQAGAILRHCDEAADCGANAVCCEVFHYEGSWHGTTTTCEGSCAYGAAAQACRTDAECGAGMTCRGYVLDSTLTVATCQMPIGCH